MPLKESSRKGKPIARRACDLCRSRKLQCTFEQTSAGLPISCTRCAQVGMPCTFLTARKPRGPPNRRVAEARAQSHSAHCSSLSNDTIEHFCSDELLGRLISDYLEYLYPLYPLVHRPRFRADFESKRYQSDPSFYRLCISLSALTVSSSSHNFRHYGFQPEETVTSILEKAHRLVVLSKVSQNPAVGMFPDVHDMICSYILSMAFHCSGSSYQGWVHASEAVLCMRKLSLFRQVSHNDLDEIDSEICKRLFWLMFIIMAHDRLAYPVSHTGISYNPVCIDWDFLVLHEVDDAEPGDKERSEEPRVTPLIAGVIALVKLYLCAAPLGLDKLPGNPRYGPFSAWSSSETPKSDDTQRLSLEEGIDIIHTVRDVIHQLPEEFAMFDQDGNPNKVPLSFAISRAKVHMTSLFIQSIILATLSANNPSFQQGNRTGSATASEDALLAEESQNANNQLFNLRRDIAQQCSHIITVTTVSALKVNGIAVVSKLREITATLLSYKVDPSCPADEEKQVQSCLERLISTLVEIDFVKIIAEE